MAESALDHKDRVALLAAIEDTLRDRWNPAQPANADEVWARLRDLGVSELIAPAADGGMNLPVTVLADVARTASRHLAPGPLVEEAFLRPWLAHHGWPRGQVAGQVALVDGGATFDWRGQRGDIRVDPTEGTLSGTVRGVANAAAATTLIVVGQRDVPGGGTAESIFSASASAPGVSLITTASLDLGCPTATVALTRVVPEGKLAATPDLIAELRSCLRVLISAELLGITEAVVELTRAYALQRHQFGRPIAGFQVIRHLLADMASRSAALGNLVTLVSSELHDTRGRARADAAAAVKAHAAEVTLTTCEQSLQIHGGIGFVEEYVLQRYFKAALRRHGLYGTPAELYERIGRSALSVSA